MHEALVKREAGSERPLTPGFRPLASAKAPFGEGFPEASKTLLRTFYPKISMVVERVLAARIAARTAARPEALFKILDGLAEELQRNADFLRKQWALGMAILRQPTLLYWLDKSLTMGERMRSFGISFEELIARTGIAVEELLSPADLSLEKLEKLSIAIPTNVTWLVTDQGTSKPVDRIDGTFTSRYLELPASSKSFPEYRALRDSGRILSAYEQGTVPALIQALEVAWARATLIGRLAAGEIDPDAAKRLLERAG